MRGLASFGSCCLSTVAALGYALAALAAEPTPVPTERIVPNELWRIGDSDDVLLGLPVEVAVGPDRNIYVLDSKLSEVKIVSPDGVLVRSIGRDGEGPGEFRNATDLAFLPHGLVGVAQPHPARLVLLDGLGKAAPNIAFDTDVAADHSRVIMRADCGGDNLVISGFDLGVRKESRSINREYFVSRFDMNGRLVHNYYRSMRSTSLDATTIREADFDTPAKRMTVAPDGRVLMASNREEYSISIFRPDGTAERPIQRDVDPWKRNGFAASVARNILAAESRPFMMRGDLDVESIEATIADIRVARDGTTWVQSFRDLYERPKGVLATWDVFNGDGLWTKRVELVAPGSPILDSVVLTGDGCVLVVTNLLDFTLVSAGLPSAAAYLGREGENLEIICYRL